MDVVRTAERAGFFEDEEYFQQSCRAGHATVERLRASCRQMGFDVLPSAQLYLSARHRDAAGPCLRLRDRGIIVRYFDKPRISRVLRISIGTTSSADALDGCAEPAFSRPAGSLKLFQHHAANRVAGAERAQYAQIPLIRSARCLWKAMTDPAELVLAYSSRMVGLPVSRPRGPEPVWRSTDSCSGCLVQPHTFELMRVMPASPSCSEICSHTRGHTSLNTLRAFLHKQFVFCRHRIRQPRLRKPKLLRMLFE